MSFQVDSINTKRYSIQICVYLHDDFFYGGSFSASRTMLSWRIHLQTVICVKRWKKAQSTEHTENKTKKRFVSAGFVSLSLSSQSPSKASQCQHFKGVNQSFLQFRLCAAPKTDFQTISLERIMENNCVFGIKYPG